MAFLDERDFEVERASRAAEYRAEVEEEQAVERAEQEAREVAHLAELDAGDEDLDEP